MVPTESVTKTSIPAAGFLSQIPRGASLLFGIHNISAEEPVLAEPISTGLDNIGESGDAQARDAHSALKKT